MRRVCVATDPHLGNGEDRCGLEFDDTDRSTVCPHPWLSHNVRDRDGLELMLCVVQWCALVQEVLDDIEAKGARDVILELVTDS